MKISHRLVSQSKSVSAVLLFGGLVYLIVHWLQSWLLPIWIDLPILEGLKTTYRGRLVWITFYQIIFDVFLNPYFYLPVIGIFYLELIIPAKKEQKVFSVGMLQDFIWFIADIVFFTIVISPYILWIRFICDQYLGFVKIDALTNLTYPLPLIIAIFASDFLIWLSHLVRHKVKYLWYFHSVHHSQTELNLFTDLRFHTIDTLIAITTAIIPLQLLQITTPTTIYYLFIQKWYLRLYHANIKSNYGFLKYLLVTPQSHRVHHSFEAKHCDKNFGTIFSIWDYLFKTQYKQYNEYPDTGINEPRFPLEKSSKLPSLLKTYWLQFIYPFQSIVGK